MQWDSIIYKIFEFFHLMLFNLFAADNTVKTIQHYYKIMDKPIAHFFVSYIC